MHRTPFVWAVGLVAWSCLQRPVVGEGSAKPREICELAANQSGQIVLRGLGRLTGNGVLLGDWNCPQPYRWTSRPRNVLVEVSRFSDATVELRFRNLVDRFDAGLVQVLVTGDVICRPITQGTEGKTESRGSGFGATGLIQCKMSNAILQKVIEIR